MKAVCCCNGLSIKTSNKSAAIPNEIVSLTCGSDLIFLKSAQTAMIFVIAIDAAINYAVFGYVCERITWENNCFCINLKARPIKLTRELTINTYRRVRLGSQF